MTDPAPGATTAVPGQAPWALAAARRLARGLVRGVVRLAMPPACLACEMPVADDGSLCAKCWSGLRLIERPFCQRLGTPFAYDHGDDALSPEAIADPPPFGKLRAAATFDGPARHLVHKLKYNDRLELAGWMAGWMARAGAEIVGDAELVVPVPLHRGRLWLRRFNQAAALADALARHTGKTFAPLALERRRATRRQVGLGTRQREENVRGAFAVPAARRHEIAGRRVLLVDDVYTTGATAAAATKVLLRAGADTVDVLVFARVASPLG